jgi:beta-lactam-binding protein with PASTA domain
MTWRARLRGSFPYLLAIVAGFALSYLVVAFVVFPSSVIPRDVKVPNVTGLMFAEAVQRLAQAGFKSEQGEQRFNNSAPKMTVLEQTPAPGSRESIGNTVTLVVSGGQRVVTVPTVIGMARSDAQALLEKEGFDIGDATETASDLPRGSVVSTHPAAGVQISVPSTISLVLSAGVVAMVMPELVGRDVETARQTLAQLGVKTVDIIHDPMAVATKGTVMGQTPVAGATMPPGSSVQLRVAGDGGGPP